MREPHRSGVNYPLLAAVVALHLLLFVAALRPATQQPADADARRGAAGESPPSSASRPTPPTQAAQTVQAAADTPSFDDDDPRHRFSAQQWRSNQMAAAAQQTQREFGALAPLADDAAQLLNATEQGLQQGDLAAARAAAELHDDCSVLGDVSAALPTGLDAELLRGFDAAAQALTQASFEARVQQLAQLQRRCLAWQKAKTRLDAARRGYAARNDADRFEALRTSLQLDAPTPDLITRLRDGLRELWQHHTHREAARALVLHLLDDAGSAQQQAGLRLLLQLAEDDDSQAEFAAAVLSRGQGRLPPQPELARQWQQRAAELGSAAAIEAQLGHELPAAAEQAWAWHAWRVWLNAHGCYVRSTPPPDALLVADLRALQQLDARLDAAARSEAVRLYRARGDAWDARARAARECDARADGIQR